MQLKRFKGIWLLATLLWVMPVLGQTPTMYNLDFTAYVRSDGVPISITPDASLRLPSRTLCANVWLRGATQCPSGRASP